MKKMMYLVMVLCLVTVLSGCSGGNEKDGEASLPDITVTATPTPAPVAASKSVEILKVTGDSVNIRSEGNTDCEVMGLAEKDEYYLVKEKDTPKDWHKIVFEGKDAFISSEFGEVSAVTEVEAAKLLKKANAEADTTSTDNVESSEPSDTTSGGQENENSGSTSPQNVNAADIRGEEDPQRR
ncbi:MAG: hypothetical protein RSC76_04305 [Oscillospiraceae bacterium]